MQAKKLINEIYDMHVWHILFPYKNVIGIH